jgi:transmembrane sensor
MKTPASSFRCTKRLVPTEIHDTAADWIARRDAGLSSAETAELNAWLSTDTQHAAVFAELEAAWANFNLPRREGRGEALFQAISDRAAQARRRHRRVAAYATAGLAAAAALAFAFLPKNPLPAAAAPSIALRPDRQVLPDGSSVELNAGAQLAVEFTPEKRAVLLMRGEALFDVVKDPARPFVVAAGQIEVRAVGTAFTVRHAHDEVAVLVTEGEVAVDRVGTSLDNVPLGASAIIPKPIYLPAGRKVAVPFDRGVAMPEATDVSLEEVAEALAWRSRRVEFTSTPLSEAVALFNRQAGMRLVLGDDVTGALRITGVFWTNDPEGFSRLLASSLGLRADTDAQGRIVLRQ